MKRLLVAVLFTVCGMAMAAGGPRPGDPCPCGTNPPFVCCGDLDCDVFAADSSFVAGQCYTREGFYCCKQNVGLRRISSESLTIQILDETGSPFDGLTNGVRVVLTVDRVPIRKGRFEDGVITWEDGSRHMRLGPDLFSVGAGGDR